MKFKFFKSMLTDKKFITLILSAVSVVCLEVLSVFHIHPLGNAAPFVFLFLIITVGHTTLYHGFIALLRLDLKNIASLMVIAILGAIYLQKYEEAAAVIILYTLAEKLEDIGMERSQSALAALVDKAPKWARVKGEEAPVAINQITVDTTITIRPGEMIPLDGIVTDGTSFVDESSVSGEPMLAEKVIHDAVFAGTLNKMGYLEIKVTKTAENSTLAVIKKLTEAALVAKSSEETFVETFSKYYTPSIICLSFSLAFIPPFLFQAPLIPYLEQALSLLVIACPCALVISTPISVYSALSNASRKGILIKGGKYLEAMGKIKVMAFDKTKTLTVGKPIVSDIIPMEGETKENVLMCAAGIEIFSEHPLAESIVAAAKKMNLLPHKATAFFNVLGKGVKADCLICDDKHHCIGTLAFVKEEHFIPQKVVEITNELLAEGKTAIVIATHQKIEGIIAFCDTIKPESKPLIEALKKEHIIPYILTGDHLLPAKKVGLELGINEVRAELLPQEKASAIEELMKKYHTVAMVGDGINDAPSLCRASVGISLGILGSAAATESASIVIMNDKLASIPFLIHLSQRMLRTIKIDIFFALIVKSIFIALALLGMSQLSVAIFADTGVTLIVIAYSLRLNKS